jgi:Na+/proline symporter
LIQVESNVSERETGASVVELILLAVLGAGLIGLLWFAFRYRQYRMLLTAGFVVGVLINGVILMLRRRGIVEPATVEIGQMAMIGGFALQFLSMFLQARDFYRTAVSDNERRARRDAA